MTQYFPPCQGPAAIGLHPPSRRSPLHGWEPLAGCLSLQTRPRLFAGVSWLRRGSPAVVLSHLGGRDVHGGAARQWLSSGRLDTTPAQSSSSPTHARAEWEPRQGPEIRKLGFRASTGTVIIISQRKACLTLLIPKPPDELEKKMLLKATNNFIFFTKNTIYLLLIDNY